LHNIIQKNILPVMLIKEPASIRQEGITLRILLWKMKSEYFSDADFYASKSLVKFVVLRETV